MKITVGRTKARKMGKTIGKAMMVFREKGAYGLDCGSGNLHGEKWKFFFKYLGACVMI